MGNWLQRAHDEIPKGPTRLTANSDVRSPNTPETSLTSLLAVGQDDPFAGIATIEQDAEIRAHVARMFPADEQADALATALRMPEHALEVFRAEATIRTDLPDAEWRRTVGLA